MNTLTKFHRETLVLIFFFGLIALAYTHPIFWQMEQWGIQDWDQHLFYHAVPRLTLLEYHQFPLWNPYYVGGTVMLANPQSRFLAPSYLLVLLLGEVVGLKVEIWLHLVIGLLGAYYLARYYQLSRPAALLTAFVFMLNSMYALTLTVGMTWFLSIAYLPWAFLFYLKGLENLKYGLVSGFFLTLIFFNGGVYPLPIAFLFFLAYSLILLSFREYSPARLLKLLIIIGVVTLGLGAVKFFPVLEFQWLYPRFVYDYSGYSLNSLQFSLFSRDQTLAAIKYLPIEQPGFLDGVTGGMDENGLYIGLLPFVLFIGGLSLRDKRQFFLLVIFLLFLWLSFGNRPRAELWSLLHLLPVYNSMRIAQRFRIIFILSLAILAGFGLQTVQDYLCRRIAHRFLAQLLMGIILAGVLIDLVLVGSTVFRDAFPIPPVKIPNSAQFYQIWQLPPYTKEGWLGVNNTGLPAILAGDAIFHIEEQPDPGQAYTHPTTLYGSLSAMYPALLANIGVIDGYESANVPRNARPISATAYQGEVYLRDTVGTVAVRNWSPNRLVIEVNVARPGFLILNQNYYPGWRIQGKANRDVEEIDQLIAVKVWPEDETIELYYRPASFVIGSLVSAGTVLSLLFFKGWRRLSNQLLTRQ